MPLSLGSHGRDLIVRKKVVEDVFDLELYRKSLPMRSGRSRKLCLPSAKAKPVNETTERKEGGHKVRYTLLIGRI